MALGGTPALPAADRGASANPLVKENEKRKRPMSLKRLSKIRLVTALMVCLLPCPGCGSDRSGASRSAGSTTIQNKGSDTMVNVAQAWAEEYRTVNRKVNVEVSGGGSGVGIAALIRGTIDIANASREIKEEEIRQARRNTGQEVKAFIAGYDALAVYVNRANPLDEIAIEQLAGIFVEDGHITRWSQLGVRIPGVRDDTIVRVSRQSSSGTYDFFRERVLDKRDFELGSRDMNGSKEVVELVGNALTAIGYSGMGYANSGVKMLRIVEKAGQPGVAPTAETTLNKTYPIARSLNLYVLGDPKGAVKEYIDWILSDAGQQIVEASGYVPLSLRKRQR